MEGIDDITIEATGYSNAGIQQVILSAYGANLALHKPTFTSANAKQPGNNATDGNSESRWESEFVDNQFIAVDLGAVYEFDRVNLNWENAAAKTYDILVSVDGLTWTLAANEAGGKPGKYYEIFNSPAKARYVKLDCHTRTTQYGFSLREFEVYTTLAELSDVSFAPELKPDATENVVGQPIDIMFGDNTDTSWRSAINEVKVNDVVISPSEYNVTDGKMTFNASLFTEAKPYWISVQAEGFNKAMVYQTILPNNGSGVPTNPPTNEPTNPPTNEPTNPPASPSSNLALNKPTVSSPDYHRSSADAVDGRLDRRWESAFSDNQWMSVDLGAAYTINRVLLNWENAYGKSYTVDVSTDGKTWNTVYATDNGHEGIDDISFAPVAGRYVKMNGIKRGTPYGFSLWEFNVYAGTTDLIEAPSLTASPTATVGEPVKLTFADDDVETAIRSVELDGVALSPSQYHVEAGQITLTAALFVSPKPYVITVRAAGYKNDSVTKTITLGSSKNLALNKLTTTSEKPLQSSNFAVDGNKNTRWESAFSDYNGSPLIWVKLLRSSVSF